MWTKPSIVDSSEMPVGEVQEILETKSMPNQMFIFEVFSLAATLQ
jgi:hypothetical protein